jgi:hypothetical protein
MHTLVMHEADMTLEQIWKKRWGLTCIKAKNTITRGRYAAKGQEWCFGMASEVAQALGWAVGRLTV